MSAPQSSSSRGERAGTMTRTGRAVVMVGKEFVVREYEVPEPAPGTILLRQELAGICGTDLHNWEYSRLEGEILLGHENVGLIEKLGDGVDADYLGQPLKVGDRVVFAPGTPTGAYGFFDAEEAPRFRGGFADYMYLAAQTGREEGIQYCLGIRASHLQHRAQFLIEQDAENPF